MQCVLLVNRVLWANGRGAQEASKDQAHEEELKQLTLKLNQREQELKQMQKQIEIQKKQDTVNKIKERHRQMELDRIQSEA